MATPAAVPFASCLSLCVQIVEQLCVAKHNKKECRSLIGVIECIQGFLQKLPSKKLSPEGQKALGKGLTGWPCTTSFPSINELANES
jgi:hypothetical protein